MPSLTRILAKASKVLSDNSPQILTAMGVAGVVSTTVLAVRATPEAIRLIELDDSRRFNNKYPEPTRLDKFKVAYRVYIPAAAVGVLTIACILAGNGISTRRNAALLSLYTLTENGFREYQEKVVSTLGEKQDQKIRDEIQQDHVDRNPVTNREVIIIPGANDVLFYESMTGRYFYSNVEQVKRAENDINQKILHEDSASQNDFFDMLGLPRTDGGDEYGWNTSNLVTVDFTATMSDDDRPAIAMKYRIFPIRGYYSSDSFL